MSWRKTYFKIIQFLYRIHKTKELKTQNYFINSKIIFGNLKIN